MIVSRSLTGGVTLAVETTLDGRHPCKLCSAIADGQKEEHQSQKELNLLKKSGDPKFVLPDRVSLIPAGSGARAIFPLFACWPTVRSDAPPTPPPLA